MSRLVSDETWAVLTIWQEARNQPFEGKQAVAEVIRNRMRRQFFSDGSLVGTILRPYQFSGWNTKDVNRIRCARVDSADPEVVSCRDAWVRSNTEHLILPEDAVFYYNPAVVPIEPAWAKEENRVAVIGAHHFFRS